MENLASEVVPALLDSQVVTADKAQLDSEAKEVQPDQLVLKVLLDLQEMLVSLELEVLLDLLVVPVRQEPLDQLDLLDHVDPEDLLVLLVLLENLEMQGKLDALVSTPRS